MNGIVSCGVYLPYHRLERAAIGAALGTSAGRGTRAVASYDEDTTSMAVEAGRRALAHAPTVRPAALYFATTFPAYLDKTNATAIHAALGLEQSAGAFDMGGAIRSAAGALRAALDARAPTLVALSDIRTGLPGGADEREGGDAAVALLCARQDDGAPVLAELLAATSVTSEFLERWRIPGDSYSRQWEERFGEHVYLPLAESAISEALRQAGVSAGQVHRLIVAGPHGRAVKRAGAAVGVKPDALGDDLTGIVGNTGIAHATLLLAAALEGAAPDEIVVVASLADGADVSVWRTTGAVGARSPAASVAQQAAAGSVVSYATFLTWRGFLEREPPRRPDPEPPAGPPSFRTEAWKFGFVGSRCQACGARHVPPQRVCVKCHAVDRMQRERLADVPATIATFTVDRLAYSLSPPVVAAVIDFEGGGRFQCELTDVDPASVAIGQKVEMTFRRLFTAEGIHNYFWKARPIR
jgi:hydroxymethylglutaryl-CoA synthase